MPTAMPLLTYRIIPTEEHPNQFFSFILFHKGDSTTDSAKECVGGGDDDEEKYLSDPGRRFRENRLTIGMVGQPNAGKSSLINSLVGRRVVSVSKTPG